PEHARQAIIGATNKKRIQVSSQGMRDDRLNGMQDLAPDFAATIFQTTLHTVPVFMTYASITGWGHGMPPAVLTNDDLSTFLDTSDEWITTRTGMKERRVSHVSAIEMASVASKRALACAELDASSLDLIVYGGCSNDEAVPNSASGVQVEIGATNAAAMDLNTACTSLLYGLSTATAMIQTGVVKNALVIGVELITHYMDWSDRNVAVLFGDGAAAVVLQHSETEEGVLGSVLGCDAEARQTLRVRGIGC